MHEIEFQRDIDKRGFGIIVCVWPKEYSVDTLTRALDKLERMLRSVDKAIVLNDIRDIRMPKANERVFIGEWIEKRKDFLGSKIACWADVSESAMLRGALKLVQFWGKDSYPREIVAERDVQRVVEKYLPSYAGKMRLPNKAELFR